MRLMTDPGDNGQPVPSTRQRLLDVAFELLLEQGYQDTTVQAVARRAGLTIGAIYANFANKHHLMAEAALRALDRVTGVYVLEKEVSFDTLRDILALQMSIPATPQHRLLTEITGVSMREMKDDSPILQNLHMVAEVARRWTSAAQERGDIDPELPLEPLVNHFVALILGSVTTKSLGLPQPDFESSQEMIQRVLDALRPKPPSSREGAAAARAGGDEG